MHSSTLERPASTNTPNAGRKPDILPTEDTTPRGVCCPVCGSGNTYQTMDGRWGCVSCGSSWA